jgi:Nuclease-related domain
MVGAVTKFAVERSPGQYARTRYERAVRRYRRRLRRPVLVFCLPPIVGATALAAGFDTAPWWWFSGGITGGLLMVVVCTYGTPPPYIAKWAVGADGERRTAKALRPILRKKEWAVRHDVQRPHENFDHVLVGPPGVFLLETKVRMGRVRLEGGTLTIRYPDDPDEIVTLPRLAGQMRARAAELRATHRFEDSARHWVTPVVVLWADFPQRCLEHDGITYLHGDELVGWLRSRPGVNAVRPQLARVPLLRRAS